jgi:hypothetical protein
MTGVRAELVVPEPSGCPLAAVSAAGEEISDVEWIAADGGGAVVEQFRADPDAAAAVGDGAVGGGAELSPVFEYENETVYEFERDPDADCACAVVESLSHPVTDVRVADGDLAFVLHVPALSDLQDVVGTLEEAGESVRVRRLTQSTGQADDGGAEAVALDWSRLTDRQLQVLWTAYRMGYFEHPRDANATEVAAELGVSPSTFTEHLTAAQSKLLGELEGSVPAPFRG